MKTLPALNDGFLLRGRVVAVDAVARTITLTDCISTPGEGVSRDLEPGLYVANVADGVALPIVGRTVAAHAAGWWLHVPATTADVDTLLSVTSEQLVAMIERLSGLREQFNESNEEHAFLSAVIHHLAAAHNATIGTDPLDSSDFDYGE